MTDYPGPDAPNPTPGGFPRPTPRLDDAVAQPYEPVAQPYEPVAQPYEPVPPAHDPAPQPTHGPQPQPQPTGYPPQPDGYQQPAGYPPQQPPQQTNQQPAQPQYHETYQQPQYAQQPHYAQQPVQPPHYQAQQPHQSHQPPSRRLSPAMLALGAFGFIGILAGAIGVSYGLGKRSSSNTDDTIVTSTVAEVRTIQGNGKTKNTRQGTPGSFTIDQIKPAMIRIETKGSYRPLGGEATASAGTGSGFIVSADGLAVTNNHVVTGAAIVEVYVGGATKPIIARVLGRSECSDLALIDINGDGFQSLEWSDSPTTPGVDVYAAGFPLGEAEPTLTRGIVSKAQAIGDTPWSSIEHVVEHDANIQPGNSGGPLVTTDGRVLAVNYAGADRANTGTTQFFAIANDIAQPVVNQLKNGDYETLGINGQAFRDEKENVSGIWVAGVADGSPASRLGLRPGDIITTMKGFPIGLDGTMRDYCKMVRGSGGTDPISVEVYRLDDKKTYAGEFNGARLEETFSFAAPSVGGADVQKPEPGSGAAPAPDELDFVNVTDDTGRISVDVPRSWGEVDGGGFDAGAGVGEVPALIASTDVERLKTADDVDVPGVLIAAIDLARFGVPQGTPIPPDMYDELLNSMGEDVKDDCSLGDRDDFDRNGVAGRYQILTECGPSKSTVFVVVAAPPDARYIMVTLFVAQTEADVYALDRVVSTFQIR